MLKKTEIIINNDEINMLKWDRLIYLINKKTEINMLKWDRLIYLINKKMKIKKTEIKNFQEEIYYYDICPAETKIIKRSNLTLYQKLRLKYPNYKNELTFIYYDKPILRTYVVVE